ncbi:MAG: PepSY-like domain-containing protein [Sphingobacteriales bacterium]
MRSLSKISFVLLLAAAAVSFLLSACQKVAQAPTGSTATGTKNTTATTTTTTATVNSAAFSSSQAIVVSATPGDTVYVVGTCTPGSKADTLAASALPASVTAYLTANYAGYTFVKAYKTLNSTSVIQGYVVNITFNGNPVGLKFNASGVFVSVLEQRQAQDLHGQGYHQGGLFGNRDGQHSDTLAVSALPAVVKTYFTANYHADTLKHVLVNRDSSLVVISNDKGVFATQFTKAGVFISRTQIVPEVEDIHATLTQAALLANITTYLTTTYPGYVFDSAFSVSVSGVVTGYVVFIDANTTKYAVSFNAGGTFVQSTTVR